MARVQNLSLLIKPASGLCNMKCRYCFYTDEMQHRRQGSAGMMSMETACRLIDEAYAAVRRGGNVSFAFQGGEPTLAGLDFYQAFVDNARKRNEKGLHLFWSLQTNGLLIDPSWAEFLRANNFLAGVSVDGDAMQHDLFRVDDSGCGTYDRAAAAVNLLQKNGVPVNLLCVVTGKNAGQPKRTYRALKNLQCGFIQLIPCLDSLPPSGSSAAAWSLPPTLYGSFLCSFFDLWYRDWQNGQYLSIRLFEDWMLMILGFPPDTCAACGACGGYLVVEADGTIYPCDFYALDEWRLGTLEEGIIPALKTARMSEFQRRSAAKPAACRTCRYWYLCRGGCPRNWVTGEQGSENQLCAAYRMFFDYAEKRLRLMAFEAVRQNPDKG